MHYWVFHAGMLEKALAEFVARRMREGASEQQAKDEALLVKMFLLSADGAPLLGGQG